MNHPLYSYVMHHFRMIYDLPDLVEIGYGKDAKVRVRQGDISFFEKENPKPEKVEWIEWKDQKLPLFFEIKPVNSLISVEEDYLTIDADIIASAFYLLSGWQEFYSKERDQFGRFPYKASVQFQYQFVETPVVNYYFDILKMALEQAYQIKLKRKLWPKHAFATCITHDIDRLNSAWKVWGTEALKAGKLKTFLKLFSKKLFKNDVWNNLNDVKQTVEKFEARSTFFFLPSQEKYLTHPAADYDINSAKIQRQIKKLSADGHEIGVHGSFGSESNTAQLLDEIQKIGQKTTGNRFHYLIYDPKKTPQILEESGLVYDSSLGFAEHFGFRNSYCFPFQPYNFKKQAPFQFIEIPLNLMDTTLLPHYLNVKPEDVLSKVKTVIDQIEKFGGCFTLLWHNEYFASHEQQGKEVLVQLLEFCKKQHTGFYLCKDLAFESKRAAAMFPKNEAEL